MNFEDLSLDPRVLAGVKNAGFTTPTPIQEQAIPHVLEGRDVLGLAQTGTGKTAAFMLPILQRLTSGPLRRIRALVVAPTRELAEQIHETAVELGKHTKIRSFPVYGGVGKGPQLGAVKRGTEIIVACPGRLLDHINEGNINLSGVEVLVLDEADRMCDMGFLPDIRRLLKQLPRNRQNLFFSATMPKDIRNLADEMLDDPVTVQIGMIAPAKTVSHALYPVPQSRKKGLLFSMLGQFDTDQVLIFTRTKRRARFLARDLEKRDYSVCALQGNMAQNRRQEAINGFRDGKYKILVATDIAARGIDVAGVSHVINFDMPDTVDAYTHRIGRTGRAHATGEAFTFVNPDDEVMVREIEKLLGKKIERRTLASFDYTAKEPAHSEGQGQGRGSGGGRNGNRNGGGRNGSRTGRQNGASSGGRSNSRGANSRDGSRNGHSSRGNSRYATDNRRSNDNRRAEGESSGRQRRARPDHMARGINATETIDPMAPRSNDRRRSNDRSRSNDRTRSNRQDSNRRDGSNEFGSDDGGRSDNRSSRSRRGGNRSGQRNNQRSDQHRGRGRQADVSNLGPVAGPEKRSRSAKDGDARDTSADSEHRQPGAGDGQAEERPADIKRTEQKRRLPNRKSSSQTRVRLPKRNKSNKS